MMPSSHIIILKEVNIPEALIKLRSDGIIHVHYQKNTVIDLNSMLFMREIYRDMAPGKQLHYIFTAAPGVTFSRDVIEISMGDSPIAAYAIIADNIAYRTIANFFLKVNKPRVPHKLFASVEEAVKWLYAQNNIQSKLLTKR